MASPFQTRNLGVIQDSSLSFPSHIQLAIKSHQLHLEMFLESLHHLFPCFLIHPLKGCNNSLLALSLYQVSLLHSIFQSTARVTFQKTSKKQAVCVKPLLKNI